MDTDGVWNPAWIRQVKQPNQILIEYEGWGKKWNEWINIDSRRLAPLYTKTKLVQCWAKISKLNWYPAMVVIRVGNTQDGLEFLSAEPRLYVEVLDSPSFRRRNK